MVLKITSSAFKHNNSIPKKYTCDGSNINPSLTIENIPKDAKSLVLLMDDPDAPMGTFVHWVVWNIPISGKINENSVPGIEGLNSAGKHSYVGPCPPLGTHRYFFKLYALDTKLDIEKNSKKEDVENAMRGHVIESGEIIGLYSRKT